MQVKLSTTITTIIDIGNTPIEEARREIFNRYNEKIEEDLAVDDIQAAQSDSVVFDTIVGTEVSHEFGGVE